MENTQTKEFKLRDKRWLAPRVGCLCKFKIPCSEGIYEGVLDYHRSMGYWHLPLFNGTINAEICEIEDLNFTSIVTEN